MVWNHETIVRHLDTVSQIDTFFDTLNAIPFTLERSHWSFKDLRVRHAAFSRVSFAYKLIYAAEFMSVAFLYFTKKRIIYNIIC